MENLNTKKIPNLRFPEFYGEWEVKKLGDIFPNIRNGFVGIATPHYREQGIPYLQGKNIKDGCIKNDGLIYISEEFHKKSIKSQLKLNDVVMVQSGHVGECALITKEYVDNNCHAILVMSPIKDIYSKFYVYFFYSGIGKKIIHIVKTGNTVEHILSSEMKTVKVSLPEIKEQKKITNFLSKIDNRIERLTKKKQLLENYKKGVMQKIFSQEIRFLDENGNDYPDWEDVELGDIITFSNGKAHENHISENGKYVVVNSKFVSSNGKIAKYSDSAISLLNVNDIVMVMSDVPNGKAIAKCFFIDENDKYTLNQRICSLREKKVVNKFLFYQLNRNSYYLKFDNGVSQTNLRKDDVLSCPVKYPPSLLEQKKIARFLTEIDEKINQASKQLEGTKKYKKGLLQKMFI